MINEIDRTILSKKEKQEEMRRDCSSGKQCDAKVDKNTAFAFSFKCHGGCSL